MSFSLLDTLDQKCLNINKLIVTFTDKNYYIPYESWTLKYTLPNNANPKPNQNRIYHRETWEHFINMIITEWHKSHSLQFSVRNNLWESPAATVINFSKRARNWLP